MGTKQFRLFSVELHRHCLCCMMQPVASDASFVQIDNTVCDSPDERYSDTGSAAATGSYEEVERDEDDDYMDESEVESLAAHNNPGAPSSNGELGGGEQVVLHKVLQQSHGKDVSHDAEVQGTSASLPDSSVWPAQNFVQREEDMASTHPSHYDPSARAAEDAVSNATAVAEPRMDDLKQIEAQAMKLSAGLKSALGGLGTQQQTLSNLAGGLANWWISLDAPSQQVDEALGEQRQGPSETVRDAHDLLDLSPEESLVESFRCKLVQTYGCNHNNFTPATQMAFQGTLYITDKHTCFTVEERNTKLPFKVLHTDILKALKQRPLRKGDLSDILRLDLSPDSLSQVQFLAFKDFESGSALDSALALVQHLMEQPK